MNSYDFGRVFVEDLRVKRVRFHKLMSYIEELPKYKPFRFCQLSGQSPRGCIRYRGEYSEIEFNSEIGNSKLTLAHEIMHYILVLEGAMLPKLKEEDNCTDIAELISSEIFRGLTHHPLLIMRLTEAGYAEEIELEENNYFNTIKEASVINETIQTEKILKVLDRTHIQENSYENLDV